MDVLVRTRAEVDEHRRRLVASLATVLPRIDGQLSWMPSSGDLAADLVARGGVPEVASRRDGGHVPVVPLLEATARVPSPFWLAWHEEWRTPQGGCRPRPRKGSVQFRTSSVSIYFGEAGGAKRQVLRGEWAGAEVTDQGAIVFQGKGAAHPHWHYAGLEAAAAEAPADPWDAFRGEAASADRIDASPFGLDDAQPEAAWDVGGLPDAVWAGVHLAASSRWAEAEWLGPEGPDETHARNPRDCDEIRRWVASCVRYVQAELQGRLQRRA